MLAPLNSLRIFLPPLFKCNFVYLFIIYISLTFIDVLLYLFRAVQAGCVGQEGKSEHFVYSRQLKVFYTGMIQKYCLTFRNCNCDPVTSLSFLLCFLS